MTSYTWHALQEERLTEARDRLNDAVFRGCLPSVPVRVLELPQANRLGCLTQARNGELAVCVESRLLSGWDTRTLPGPEHLGGRTRLAEDVLLHELVHVAIRKARWDEEAHGWMWWRCVRELSGRLDLPDPSEEKAHTWPLSIRPNGYYGQRDPLAPLTLRAEVRDFANRLVTAAAKGTAQQAGYLLSVAKLWDYAEEVLRRREVLNGAA